MNPAAEAFWRPSGFRARHLHQPVIHRVLDTHSSLVADRGGGIAGNCTRRLTEPTMEMTTPNSHNTVKNSLSSDVEIKGNLKFAGELMFDGKLEGEIHTEGTLQLGETAVVNGNINAQTVIVRGKINGNVFAKEKIEIKSKAELFGDIRSAKLVIEEGVTFVGKTEVNPNKVSPTPPPRNAEPTRNSEPVGKAGGR